MRYKLHVATIPTAIAECRSTVLVHETSRHKAPCQQTGADPAARCSFAVCWWKRQTSSSTNIQADSATVLRDGRLSVVPAAQVCPAAPISRCLQNGRIIRNAHLRHPERSRWLT